MAAHRAALVPLTGTAMHSSRVARVIEALVFHDDVALWADEPDAWAELLAWFVDPGEIETLLIFLRDGVVRFAGNLALLDHAAVASVMKGQWRHPRLLKYAQTHAVALTSTSDWTAALELRRDLFPSQAPAEVVAVGPDPVEIVFPDVRRMVREQRFDVRRLLALRRAARPLREWLQLQGSREVAAFVELGRELVRKSDPGPAAPLRVIGDLEGRLDEWSPFVFSPPERFD